jgi:hypothetical protein
MRFSKQKRLKKLMDSASLSARFLVFDRLLAKIKAAKAAFARGL